MSAGRLFAGYIDLSKRRVYTKDLRKCEERFAKARAVNSILRHVADQLGYDSDAQLEQLYENTAWHFDRKFDQKAAAYDVFKKAIRQASADSARLESTHSSPVCRSSREPRSRQ